jgi:hypothetical protein
LGINLGIRAGEANFIDVLIATCSSENARITRKYRER